MASTCGACNVVIVTDEFVSCRSCKEKYHTACVNPLSDEGRRTRQKSKDWTCPDCAAKLRLGAGNSNSPRQKLDALTDGRRSSMSSLLLPLSPVNIVPPSGPSSAPGSAAGTPPPHTSSSLESFPNTTADNINQLPVISQQLNTIQRQLTVLAYLPRDMKEIREEITALKASVDYNSKWVEDLNNKLSCLESKAKLVDQLKLEVDCIKTEIKSMQADSLQQEQWSRRSNIELVGVPEKKSEDLIRVVTELAKFTGFDLNPRSDIDFVTRVAPRELKKGQTKPIVIRMLARHRKDAFLAAIRGKTITSSDIGCGGSLRVFGNDHLTSTNKQLLRQVKLSAKEKGYKYVWVRNCRILARHNDNSPIIAFQNESDLKKIV